MISFVYILEYQVPETSTSTTYLAGLKLSHLYSLLQAATHTKACHDGDKCFDELSDADSDCALYRRAAVCKL